MENKENMPTKLGLKTVLGYLVGIMLLIAGVTAPFMEGYGLLLGISYIICGLIIFPPFWVYIKNKYNFEASKWVKIVAFFAVIIIGGTLSPEGAPVQKTTVQPKPSASAVSPSKPVAETKQAPSAPKTLTTLDKLWVAVDTSINSRNAIELTYDQKTKEVVLMHTDTSFWDESALVRGGVVKFINFGQEAFKIEGIDKLTVQVKTELTDTYGTKKTVGVFLVEMSKEKFQKFDWNALKGQDVGARIKSVADIWFIHPSILPNVKMDKIYYL